MALTVINGRTVIRYFGKCPVKGCKTRVVSNSTDVNGYHMVALLREAGKWCVDHDKELRWSLLNGRFSDKECNGVCMAAVGPSCDCSCGGENHGKSHVIA